MALTTSQRWGMAIIRIVEILRSISWCDGKLKLNRHEGVKTGGNNSSQDRLVKMRFYGNELRPRWEFMVC